MCEEVIEGTYYQLNDQVFCEKDYLAHMDKCGKCDKEIEGKVIRITGSVFHPDCFTCEVIINETNQAFEFVHQRVYSGL